MSEETKKTAEAPEQEAKETEAAPQEAPETAAAPEKEAEAEPADAKKKDGWFNKNTLEMAANAPTTDENYKKGVTMTLDKAAKALDTLHVEEIEALGKPFDPNFMNAVQQIPAPDGQESGTVITVYQKGYKLGDKIVRHATVVVAE